LVVSLARDGAYDDAERLNAAAEAARSRYAYRWRWPHIDALRAEALGLINRFPRQERETPRWRTDSIATTELVSTALAGLE
jgi:hypothetical protein